MVAHQKTFFPSGFSLSKLHDFLQNLHEVANIPFPTSKRTSQIMFFFHFNCTYGTLDVSLEQPDLLFSHFPILGAATGQDNFLQQEFKLLYPHPKAQTCKFLCTHENLTSLSRVFM